MTRLPRWLLLPVLSASLAIALGVTGCKKDSSGGAAASNLPVKGPWEAVKVTYENKKAADGSPQFKLENTGQKTVKVVFIDFYAYDAKGAQVGSRKELDFNRELKGGESTEVSTGDIPGAVTWEAGYHGIELDGDKLVTDNKRSPDKKPKGK